MSDPGTEGQPLGEPKKFEKDNSNATPKKDHPITEDPDGTPVENPSGG